jgi:hypothetical protein
MIYEESGSKYNGHFVFAAEFLPRAAVNVSLGTPSLWRSDIWRIGRLITKSCGLKKRRRGPCRQQKSPR